MLLLGLDLGTTNAKAAAYDLDGGLQAEASVSYPTHFPQPGWAEQRPLDWITALTSATRQLVARLGKRAEELAGAALSCQGPGLVLVDRAGMPLTETSPTWQDERCAREGQWLFERISTPWPGLGGPFTNFPAKLRWAQRHQPEAIAKTAYAMGIKDYLVHWLTGVVATEPTSGSGGPQWHEEVYAKLDWSLDRLPRIAQPTDVVGNFRTEIVRQLGLPRPLPLVIGLNDGAAATLATGAVTIGDVIVTLSTNGVLRVVMDEPLPAPVRLEHALFNWPYLPPRLWIAGGQTKAGARALQWFAEAIGGPQPADMDVLLAEAAESPAGSAGVTFLPYLMGRGSPHSDAARTGSFLGLRLSTRRGEMTRAVLEGTAFALRDIQDDFAEFGHAPGPIKLSGGGGRSPLWRQIIAEVLGQPVTYYATDSTLGSAMIAAVGLGLYRDLASAAAAMSSPGATRAPSAANVERYAQLRADFRHARDSQP